LVVFAPFENNFKMRRRTRFVDDILTLQFDDVAESD
jgi:hypothetical protein